MHHLRPASASVVPMVASAKSPLATCAEGGGGGGRWKRETGGAMGGGAAGGRGEEWSGEGAEGRRGRWGKAW